MIVRPVVFIWKGTDITNTGYAGFPRIDFIMWPQEYFALSPVNNVF